MERIREQQNETRFWISSTQAVHLKRLPTEGGQETWLDPVSDICMLADNEMNPLQYPGLKAKAPLMQIQCIKSGDHGFEKIHRLDDCHFFCWQALYSRDFGSFEVVSRNSLLLLSCDVPVRSESSCQVPDSGVVFYRLCDKKVTVEEKVYPKIMHRFVLVFLHRLYENIRPIVSPRRSLQLHFLL